MISKLSLPNTPERLQLQGVRDAAFRCVFPAPPVGKHSYMEAEKRVKLLGSLAATEGYADARAAVRSTNAFESYAHRSVALVERRPRGAATAGQEPNGPDRAT
jgi:hypothetical protein